MLARSITNLKLHCLINVTPKSFHDFTEILKRMLVISAGFSTTSQDFLRQTTCEIKKFIFTFKFLHKNLYQTPGKLLLLKQTLRPGLAKRGVGQNFTLQINNTLDKGMIDVFSCSINYFEAEYCHGETK